MVFDCNGGTSVDASPLFHGNDFTGATKDWATDHAANNLVFPIVSGNRGGRTWQVGDVTPASAVTAIQGSRYTWRNGDSTQDFYKSTGTGNTGWSAALVVP